MKPARIHYVAVLAIFLLATAVAWTSLLEAGGPHASTWRLLSSAQLFERQGRVVKAVELYQQILRAEPGHNWAATRLAKIRAAAQVTLRATQPKQKAKSIKTRIAEATAPAKAKQAAQEPKPAQLAATASSKLEQKATPIRTTIANTVATLKTRRRKSENGASSAETTQRPLAKTRQALSQAGERIKNLRPVASAVPSKPKLANSIPSKPQISSTAKSITTVSKESPTVATAEPVAEVTSATETRNQNVIVTRTITAWDRIREKITPRPKTAAGGPKPAAISMWQSLRNSLKKSRDNLALKLGRKPKVTDTVTKVEEPQPAAVTVVKPDQAASTAKPVAKVAPNRPSNRPPVIPPVSSQETIFTASETLSAKPDEANARAVLIEAVEVAPDVEASLAAYMLGTRASGHPEVMSALGEQLSARTGIARVHMAEAMLRLDGNHVTATDALVGLLSDEEPQVRMMAALAMQSATVTQKERCISTLIKVLQDTDSEVRAAAALALGGYGPAAKAALPALVRLVHDENVDTARAAGIALQCVAPPPASAQVDTRVTPVSAGADHGQ